MKQFIYKMIVSIIAIVLVYEFTIGKLIKNILINLIIFQLKMEGKN